MKKLTLTFLLILIGNFALANCGCENPKSESKQITNIGAEGKRERAIEEIPHLVRDDEESEVTDQCLKSLTNIGTDGKKTKCLDLMTTMYNNRATLYNVLNLSTDQKKCKDVIDAKRYEELGKQFNQFEQEKYVLAKMNEHQASKQAVKKQQKVVNDIEKCMQKTNKKYDKEFKTVLNSEQKTKLNMIRRMEKKAIKHCEKNKAFYKQDPNLRPFGEKTGTSD